MPSTADLDEVASRLQRLEATTAADRVAVTALRDARSLAPVLGRLREAEAELAEQWHDLWEAEVQAELQHRGSPFDTGADENAGSDQGPPLPLSVVFGLTAHTAGTLQGSGTLVVLLAPAAAAAANLVLMEGEAEVRLERTCGGAKETVAQLRPGQAWLTVDADMSRWHSHELRRRHGHIHTALQATEHQRYTSFGHHDVVRAMQPEIVRLTAELQNVRRLCSLDGQPPPPPPPLPAVGYSSSAGGLKTDAESSPAGQNALDGLPGMQSVRGRWDVTPESAPSETEKLPMQSESVDEGAELTTMSNLHGQRRDEWGWKKMAGKAGVSTSPCLVVVEPSAAAVEQSVRATGSGAPMLLVGYSQCNQVASQRCHAYLNSLTKCTTAPREPFCGAASDYPVAPPWWAPPCADGGVRLGRRRLFDRCS